MEEAIQEAVDRIASRDGDYLADLEWIAELAIECASKQSHT